MKNDLEKIINPNINQVFILSCPANFPFSFARHLWFICNEKWQLSRWEVLFRKNKNISLWHLHLNYFSPFSGIEIFPFFEKLLRKWKLISKIEWEIAEKMIIFIKESKENYPYRNYNLVWTNSNTYVKWILNNFKEINIKLPWNSFWTNPNKF